MSIWILLHSSLIMMGLACLITSFSTAVMYLLLAAQLKSKKFGNIFFKLPPLETLDRIHFRGLSWGVVLFTLGLVSGFFWAESADALGKVLKDPRILLSFTTCLMYWWVLSFRLGAASRGRKIVMGTVISFLLLVVMLASSGLAPSWYHKGS